MQLRNDEYMLVRVKKHWIYLLWPLVGTCVFLPLFPLAVIWFLYMLARYFLDEITLTNQKLYVKIGFVDKEIQSIPLSKIREVSFQPSIPWRIFRYGLFDYGTIYLHMANMPGGVDYVQGGVDYGYIANPESVKTAIEQAVAAAKAEQK